MTTLCYKDGWLASDSRVTSNGFITNDNMQKIFKLNTPFKGEKALAVALAGSWGHTSPFLEALQNECVEEVGPDWEIGAIVVTDKNVYIYESYFITMPKGPISVGTGEKIALTAMNMGATAKEAVKIAIKMDAYTGGRVQAMKLR